MACLAIWELNSFKYSVARLGMSSLRSLREGMERHRAWKIFTISFFNGPWSKEGDSPGAQEKMSWFLRFKADWFKNRRSCFCWSMSSRCTSLKNRV